MYRRFAVITVAVTLPIALVAEDGPEAEETAPFAASGTPAGSPSAFVQTEMHETFDDELPEMDSFGEPTELAAGEEEDRAYSASGPNAIPPGYLASLDETERKAAIEAYNQSRVPPDVLARMDEESRIRSGAPRQQ